MTRRLFCPTSAIVALSTVAVAFWLPASGLARAAEARRSIVVEFDQAKLVNLPRGQGRIILVDPTIVRVTLLSDGSRAVLTGLAFGETVMTVIDGAGAVLMQSTVQVKEPSDSGITVQRGQERSSYYDCARQCQGRLKLGDTSREFKDIGEQIRGREELITSITSSGGT